MIPKRVLRNDVKNLTPADRTALCMIYTHRCLTEDQLRRYYYASENPKKSYTKWHVQKLLSEGYIQPIDYNKAEPALFLAARGIIMVNRLFKLESTRLSGVAIDTIDLHWKAYNLMLHPSKINHQIFLNEFVLEFNARADLLGINYEYQDEKFVPAKDYTSARARPDGMIDLPNITLYLELDMNTEKSFSFNKKWDCYRTLLNTNTFWDMRAKKPIVVLFITENVIFPLKRRTTILNSINTHFMDCISENFDMYVDNHESIMNIIFRKLIKNEKDSVITDIESILSKNYAFDFRDIGFLQNTDLPCYELYGKSKSRNFFIDSYEYAPLSVLKKIATVGTNFMLSQAQLKMDIYYLVATNDSARLLNDLKTIHGYNSNVVGFAIFEKHKPDLSCAFVKYDAFLSSHKYEI